MALNRYPLWKNALIILVVAIALVYAIPNLFGSDPAVQVSGSRETVLVNKGTDALVKQALGSAGLSAVSCEPQQRSLLCRFASTDIQQKAKQVIQKALGSDYWVALNMAPRTPAWLKAIGAVPMKYGLDLRGGIHLLIQVDVDSVLAQQVAGDLNHVAESLRTAHVRYASIQRHPNDNSLVLTFRSEEAVTDALHLLGRDMHEFVWTPKGLTLSGVLSPVILQQSRQDVLDQIATTLRNRVNELGVSEAVVTQQGATRMSVDLPGVQDTAAAKNILGKVATLEFHLVDMESTGIDSTRYPYNGRSVFLKNPIILHGSSIVSAHSGAGEDGRASVDVRLGSGGTTSLFSRTTAENIGKLMAILYVEMKPTTTQVNGKKVIQYETERRVISVATIQSALSNFQITGLASPDEARTLALLLRAGALSAPVAVIEEREVGPSLGKQNIHRGVMSVTMGFLLVVLFMGFYYRTLGWVADLALGMNLILIVAVLSLLGATLTLPGIAGMVLTVAMAADANVLIFERIREECRNGNGIQASIQAGYERAFVTILDANMTLLIVAVVLFSLGSSVVKSFAVTVSIGLLTSMLTAITGTRAVVNKMYGGRSVKHISIG